MNKVVGYAIIKPTAQTGVSAVDIELFRGEICRVLEFSNYGVLVVDREATGIAMFDNCDVLKHFKCKEECNVICHPDLSFHETMIYISKCMSRKGGYNNLLKQMVINISLHKGVFTDNILWQKQ